MLSIARSFWVLSVRPGYRAFNSLFPSTCRAFAPGSHRLPLPRRGPLPLRIQECGSPARMRGSATARRSSRPGAGPWVTQGARAQSPFEGFPSNHSATPTIHSCFFLPVTHEKSLPSGTSRTKTVLAEGCNRYQAATVARRAPCESEHRPGRV